MSNISISESNLSRYVKRAHDELTKLDPSLKLSQAGEVFARILGNSNYHELQKHLQDSKAIYIDVESDEHKDELIKQFKEKVALEDAAISKQNTSRAETRIDSLLAITDELPFYVEFKVMDDNKIFADLDGMGISIPLRFGKFKDVKYKNYDGMQAHIMNSAYGDHIKQSVFDYINVLQNFNEYFNNERPYQPFATISATITTSEPNYSDFYKDRAYDADSFKYFVRKIMEREYDQSEFVSGILKGKTIELYNVNGIYNGYVNPVLLTVKGNTISTTVTMTHPNYTALNSEDFFDDIVMVFANTTTHENHVATRVISFNSNTGELVFVIEDIMVIDLVAEKYAQYL